MTGRRMDRRGKRCAVRRVARMERCFDALRARDPAQIRQDPALCRMLEELTAYYEGGQWLRDYLADQQGRFPARMKRGVLSQDGVWDLLTELEGG